MTLPTEVETNEDKAEQLSADYKTARDRTRTDSWSVQFKPYLWLLIADTVAVGLGFAIAYLVRFETGIAFFSQYDPDTDFYTSLVFVLVSLWLLLFATFKLYDSHFLFGGTQEYARVFNACSTGMMLLSVFSFLYPDRLVSRGWLLLSWVLVAGLVAVGRFVVRRLVYRLRSQGKFLRATIIVGADEKGKDIAAQIANNPGAGIWMIGFIDDHLPKGTEVFPGLRVIGCTVDAKALVYQLGAEELILSSALGRDKQMELFRIFGTSGYVNVNLSPDIFEIMTTGRRFKEVGQTSLLHINRLRLTGSDALLKRILDQVGAMVGLVILSPIFWVIAIAIKRSSPGPIFHRRRVVGVGGKEFDAFKFRTMVVNADEVLEQNPELKAEFEKNFKLKDDPRVTAIGKILRRTSLDALPQLVNVQRGEMSLVGPRVITPEEIVKYGKRRSDVLTVKPGITGLWQTRFVPSHEDEIRLDLHYIRNYSVWLDFQLIFQTLPALLRRKSDYQSYTTGEVYELQN